MTSFLTVAMSFSCYRRNCRECGKDELSISNSVMLQIVFLQCVRGDGCVFRMVRNISRGEEGRVMSEDLHRILGETC